MRSILAALLFSFTACSPSLPTSSAPTSTLQATSSPGPAIEPAGELAAAVVVGAAGRTRPTATLGLPAEVGEFWPPHAPIQSRPPGRWIDAHTHLSGFDAWPEIKSVLDENGIDYVINLSGGSPRRGHSLATKLAQDSGGRIINFMTVDWNGVDEIAFGDTLAAELELLVTQYGYAGLKISKGLGLFAKDYSDTLIAVDDPRLFPLWKKAGDLGVPVFIHTGDPVAFWQPVTPENERYEELLAHPSWSFAGPEFPPLDTLLAQRDHLLELFPNTIFVGVHFGCKPEDIAYVDRLLTKYPNFYVDLAARVPEIGRADPAQLREIFIRHQDKILFATDLMISNRRGQTDFVLGSGGADPNTRVEVKPFFDAHRQFFETSDRNIAHPTPIQGKWTVNAINLPPEVIDKVYYLNTWKLVVEKQSPPARWVVFDN